MKTTTFDILENGIYKIHWWSNNLDEIQAYAEWFITEHSKLPSGSTMRILHNYSEVDAPPFNRIKDTIRKFNLQQGIILRIAHVSGDLAHELILQNATTVARLDANRKFFKANEEAEAIAWLLEDQSL